ncbi:MAG: hypothetical protein ACREMU_06535, partial [Gemmatimonadaceae bacterium]
AFREKAAALATALSHIEDSIYQVRTRSSEDPLNYPIGLNDKLAELASYVDDGNSRPTAQQYAVYRELSARLDPQLRALHTTLRDLTALNSILRAAGLPEIVPSTKELSSDKAPVPLSDDLDQDEDDR